MIKLCIALVCCLPLSGCFYQSANNTDLKKAIYFCDGISNIERIKINSTGSEYVKCFSGEADWVDKIKI
jgi:hypothetical protein